MQIKISSDREDINELQKFYIAVVAGFCQSVIIAERIHCVVFNAAMAVIMMVMSGRRCMVVMVMRGRRRRPVRGKQRAAAAEAESADNSTGDCGKLKITFHDIRG